MSSTKSESRKWSLETLMDALAMILIQVDVTPAQLTEISRASFVKAGASLTRKKRSGALHIARIAALTGLSRSEVRKIIDSNYVSNLDRLDQLPRALRVAAAWSASPKYTRNGKSIELRVNGRAPSFATLCKAHSGDIPHKTIVTDLLARRLIRLKKVGDKSYVRLIRPTTAPQFQALDTLEYIARFLDSLSSPERILVRQRQIVRSPRNLSAAYFQNSIASRVASFVEDLPIEKSRRSGGGRAEDALDIFALVSRKTKKT
jgi:hypothetical protein